jgi:hypothetical protein
VAGGGAKHNDHVVIGSTHSVRTAEHFSEAFGIEAGHPHPAVQPGAVFATVKSGTHGMPLGFIQCSAVPAEDGDSN